MRCLVTGAAGFVGSHLAERLIGDGCTVTGVDALTDFYPARLKERNLEALTSSPAFTLVRRNLLELDLADLVADFTFVGDVVDATCRAASAEVAAGSVVNVAGGTRVELGEAISKLERLTGRRAELEAAPPPPGEMPHTYADVRRAEALLGWVPKTTLADGLAEEVAWIDRLARTGDLAGG